MKENLQIFPPDKSIKTRVRMIIYTLAQSLIPLVIIFIFLYFSIKGNLDVSPLVLVIIFLIYLLLALITTNLGIWRITAESDLIRIKYYIKTRKIPYSSIDSFSIDAAPRIKFYSGKKKILQILFPDYVLLSHIEKVSAFLREKGIKKRPYRSIHLWGKKPKNNS